MNEHEFAARQAPRHPEFGEDELDRLAGEVRAGRRAAGGLKNANLLDALIRHDPAVPFSCRRASSARISICGCKRPWRASKRLSGKRPGFPEAEITERPRSRGLQKKDFSAALRKTSATMAELLEGAC